MKALTIWQPWASFIALGLKQYETRSWNTNYRGPLAIHAAKRPIRMDEVGRMVEVYRTETDGANYHALFVDAHLGSIIAVCDLVDCIPMTPDFIAQQPPLEEAVGFWEEGRYALKLEGVRRLVEPLPVSGRQGLWNVPPAIIQQMRI